MNRLLVITLCCPLLATAAVNTGMSPPEPPHAAAPQMVPPPASPATPAALPPAAPAPAADAAAIPQAFPRARYEVSWKKNPFLLKVAVIAQVKESWAADYALTSIAKMSGTYRVGIRNKKTGETKRLTEGAEADSEFKIVAVNFQPNRKSSSVEVEKGGEKASLTYDATMMTPQARGAAPGQPGMARPGMPVIPGQPGGNVPQPNMRTTSAGGPPGGPGSMVGASGNFQRPQSGGGNMPPGYAGNMGGAYGGGAPGSANATTGGNPAMGGATTTSRLGALGPRTSSGGSSQNSLVPVVGGTFTTGTTGTTTVQDPGNVVINATDTTGTTTTTTETGNTTPVTRRRTLIPAPVITQ